MEETVAILAFTIMAVGLITLIVGLTQFVKMLSAPGGTNTTPPLPAHSSEAAASTTK